MARLTLLALVAAAGAASACAPPDCDNVDHGSCVQACCKLGFDVAGVNASEASTMLTASFNKKGPDGLYVFWGTVPDQGPLTFVVQGQHWTVKHKYVDSLSFGIMASAAGVRIEGFSHSQDFIQGDFAYGDYGQNYKNLVTIMKDAFGQDKVAKPDILLGCPTPAAKGQ
eukprot:TRINITY_DN12811_c0_g1_i1.p1 TRINITY_DN12811_c0_g1~~TRINITY_DN12811_c0_g1_i1.p1  ORF type:complete len:195 (+),score=86.19 TRINITY_DN12811_c0_g1_i1:79-585(+)